jgi:hypothetical protein
MSEESASSLGNVVVGGVLMEGMLVVVGAPLMLGLEVCNLEWKCATCWQQAEPVNEALPEKESA